MGGGGGGDASPGKGGPREDEAPGEVGAGDGQRIDGGWGRVKGWRERAGLGGKG